MVWDTTNNDAILKARRDLLAVQRTDRRVGLGFDVERRVHYQPGDDGALQGSGCRFPTRRTSGAFNTYLGRNWRVDRRMFVAFRGIPAVSRFRIPARCGPVDLGCPD